MRRDDREIMVGKCGGKIYVVAGDSKEAAGMPAEFCGLFVKFNEDEIDRLVEMLKKIKAERQVQNENEKSGDCLFGADADRLHKKR